MRNFIAVVAIVFFASCATKSQIRQSRGFVEVSERQELNKTKIPPLPAPGSDPDTYWRRLSLENSGSSKCGESVPFMETLEIHRLHRVHRRANAVIVEKNGLFLATTGCFQPEGVAMADMDGIDGYDLNHKGEPFVYRFGSLNGVLSIPMMAGESVRLYYVECHHNVCKKVAVKQYIYTGHKRKKAARSGRWLWRSHKSRSF